MKIEIAEMLMKKARKMLFSIVKLNGSSIGKEDKGEILPKKIEIEQYPIYLFPVFI